MRDPEPRIIRLSEYRPTDWLIEHVDLAVGERLERQRRLPLCGRGSAERAAGEDVLELAQIVARQGMAQLPGLDSGFQEAGEARRLVEDAAREAEASRQ